MSGIRSVLAYLDSTVVHDPVHFQDWQIFPVTGGANNLLYRISGDAGDYAVKFTVKDERRRAAREYYALCALNGHDLAPRPVLLDEESYSQPVNVQTWLEGDVIDSSPETDAEWESLVGYFACLHSLPPDSLKSALPTGIVLQRPVLYAETPQDCRQIVRDQLERLPPDAHPDILQRLIAQYEAQPLPEWDTPALTLLRADPNPRNFIRRTPTWASVDLEYSGISDPAFEIADMVAHAAYIDVPRDRWEQVIDRYCSLRNDRDCELRIRTYWRALVMWWVVRFNRYFYEIPRGLDARLAQRPANWREISQAKYEHYLELAESML